jgi:hypothetical protein
VKKTFVVAVVATLFSLALAQDSKTLPPAAIGQKVISPAIPGRPPLMAPDWQPKPPSLPFCPPKTCLYYAGDFESSTSSADALFNANDTGLSLEGQAWVGVKPARASLITGSTFNELFTPGFAGTNPAVFQAQTGITTGNPGKLICNTVGNATLTVYGESDFGLVQSSYTIKKLKKACRVQVGSAGATYVNLLPTSSNGYGYVVNTDSTNHVGWTNDADDCYFDGTAFNADYVPCITQGSFDLLSIALTGKP